MSISSVVIPTFTAAAAMSSTSFAILHARRIFSICCGVFTSTVVAPLIARSEIGSPTNEEKKKKRRKIFSLNWKTRSLWWNL
jgi:hypothetical protein